MKKNIMWWQKSKFGLFIHYGIYSAIEKGEWIMFWEKIPLKEYKKYIEKFNPKKNITDKWVKLAKEAGMKYAVLTTKHHDGFCLFNTKYSNFNSYRILKRDIVKEFVDSCRKYDLKIGLYYSLADWSKEDYFKGPSKNSSNWKKFINYTHGQVEELVKNYGKIDIIWYDGSWKYNWKQWKSKKLNNMVRKYQPEIVINNRSGLPEDFDTPEQHILPSERPWECAMPVSDFWWGYNKGDKFHKDTYTVIKNLIYCISHGGNLILNVGPEPDGEIEKVDEKTLKEVGKWIKENKDSIYGVEKIMAPPPSPRVTHFGFYSKKENKIFLYVLYWNKNLVFANAPGKVKKAYLLKDGRKINFKQEKEKIYFTNLPEKPHDKYVSVITLEI